MNKFLTVTAVTMLALGVSACAEHRAAATATSLPPGKYEHSSQSTDSRGTRTERESSTNVYVDEYGNKKAVVKSETTRDPKGLFNKTTTSKTRTVVD